LPRIDGGGSLASARGGCGIAESRGHMGQAKPRLAPVWIEPDSELQLGPSGAELILAKQDGRKPRAGIGLELAVGVGRGKTDRHREVVACRSRIEVNMICASSSRPSSYKATP
jgi:hypothetical protein